MMVRASHHPLWHNVQSFFLSLSPFLITLAAVIIAAVPAGLGHSGAILPDLLLISVFYWAVHRPELLPVSAVLVCGLTQDVLSGDVFGLNALTAVLIYGIATHQRRFLNGKPFTVLWSAFAGMYVVVLSSTILLSALTIDRGFDAWALIVRSLVNFSVYPLCVAALSALYLKITDHLGV